ncbi:hypothetical protein FKM82_015395 [Ascaphus truei]
MSYALQVVCVCLQCNSKQQTLQGNITSSMLGTPSFNPGVANSSPQWPPTRQVLRISLLQHRWLSFSFILTEPLIEPLVLKQEYPENLTRCGT